MAQAGTATTTTEVDARSLRGQVPGVFTLVIAPASTAEEVVVTLTHKPTARKFVANIKKSQSRIVEVAVTDGKSEQIADVLAVAVKTDMAAQVQTQFAAGNAVPESQEELDDSSAIVLLIRLDVMGDPVLHSFAFMQEVKDAVKRIEKQIDGLRDEMAGVKTVADPVVLGSFKFNGTAPVTFALPDAVPEARVIRVHCFLRTGMEGPERDFLVTVQSVDGDGTAHFGHVWGTRYGQVAISYTNVYFDLPIARTSRQITVQCADIQLTNCHNMELFVTGWK